MRGRKPQPTALKVLRGNPGKRPLNLAEPVHAPLSETCPEEVSDPVARAEWDRVAPLLIARGQVTVVDRGVLMGYCVKYAQWRALAMSGLWRQRVLARRPDVALCGVLAAACAPSNSPRSWSLQRNRRPAAGETKAL